MMNIKIENIVKNGYNRPYLSKFLTVQEQSELAYYNKEINISYSNTYSDEERKRAFVSSKDISITPDFKISYLKINSKSKLRHPDILGAILSLGLDREVIGDIIVESQIVLCTNEVADYIINNLQVINKHTVEVEFIDQINLSKNNNYKELQIVIASLRLDGILAKGLNLSRGNAQELISQRVVRVKGEIETRCDYNCKESDMISISRFGRLKILDVTRKTKKDKLVLNILLTKI